VYKRQESYKVSHVIVVSRSPLSLFRFARNDICKAEVLEDIMGAS